MAHYWMYKKSGQFQITIRKLFDEEKHLDDMEIYNLKKYIGVCIDDKNFKISKNDRIKLRNKLSIISTKQDILNFYFELCDKWNIGPF